MGVQLQHPSLVMVAGPSGCGKSTIVEKILKFKNSIFVPSPPLHVIWCYSIQQPLYNRIKGVTWMNRVPAMQELKNGKSTLLIIDDLMGKYDDIVASYFTAGSHHMGITVIYIVQNLFNKSKQHRTISLNTHYLFLCKNPRDAGPVYHLARSIYPMNSKFLIEAYKDATFKPYGYLFIDMRQETKEKFRLMTDIFPGEITYVYTPSKCI